MSAPAPDIVSLGEPMYEFSQIAGQRTYLQGFGGDTMNCAIAAARQGAKVAYLTRLGNDEFGRQLRELWQQENVDAAGVGTDAEAHTAVYFITHGPAGHVFSYMRKGSAASRMRPEHLNRDLIRAAKFFHTSGISQAISESARETVRVAIETARAAGVSVVYDCNLRPRLWPLDIARAVITATVAQCDYFLLSVEDAELLCGLTKPEAILDWCHAAGAPAVALKLGAEGVIGSDATRRMKIGGHRVDCVDATGAGDCFAGTLLARMAAGEEFMEALAYANAAAAIATTGYGAVAPLPHAAQVRELLERTSGRAPGTPAE